MNRREFLKVSCMAGLTVFLSGCGLSAMADEKKVGAKGKRIGR